MFMRCALNAYNDYHVYIESLALICDHPMVGNRFALISRMGQTESSPKKFIINLFMREKILKI